MSMTSIWDLSSHLNELILVWFENVPVRQFSCWHQRNFYGFYTGVIWQWMSLCVGFVIVCSELSDISDRRELLLWLDISGNGTFCRHSRGPMFTLCISFSAALTPLAPAAQNRASASGSAPSPRDAAWGAWAVVAFPASIPPAEQPWLLNHTQKLTADQ